jgi:hypothetical protein
MNQGASDMRLRLTLAITTGAHVHSPRTPRFTGRALTLWNLSEHLLRSLRCNR